MTAKLDIRPATKLDYDVWSLGRRIGSIHREECSRSRTIRFRAYSTDARESKAFDGAEAAAHWLAAKNRTRLKLVRG